MIHVLLVEDDEIDAALVQHDLQKLPVRMRINHVRDGDECMNYLRDPMRRRPDVIFLDLKMPIKGGREVLAEMKVDPALAIIPVVVISGSDVDADRQKAYELGANAYVNKPGDRGTYTAVMEDVWRYWLLRNRPPP